MRIERFIKPVTFAFFFVYCDANFERMNIPIQIWHGSDKIIIDYGTDMSIRHASLRVCESRYAGNLFGMNETGVYGKAIII